MAAREWYNDGIQFKSIMHVKKDVEILGSCGYVPAVVRPVECTINLPGTTLEKVLWS